MRQRIFRTFTRCASASGAKCEFFSRPQAAKYFSIFMGSVCLAVHLSHGFASKCIEEMNQQGQNVTMIEES